MDRYESYDQVPLFTALAASEIADLLAGTEEVDAAPGDVLMSEGEPGAGLYLVASGSYRVQRSGVAEPLAILGELAHFGEVSLITNEPCSATVSCEEPGRLRLLTHQAFGDRLRRRDPVALMVVLNMARVLARRMMRSESRLAAGAATES